MDHFIKPVDELSTLINEKATDLFNKLSSLPIEALDLPDHVVTYLEKYHHGRQFFSVQTAAELLYRSISMQNKPVADLTVMDYGAGMGCLYMLAKMIGCKEVIYNDLLPDNTAASGIISRYLGIPVDLFVASDHKGTLRMLKDKNIDCDIILSRNVVEHIYDLDEFYGDMAKGQPGAMIFFSTTANYQNPGMLWYHKKLHRDYEVRYKTKREMIIKEKMKDISDMDMEKLATATRGLAVSDLDDAILRYRENGTLPDPSVHYTNTCDPDNGIWAEHIIPVADYRRIIESKGYRLSVKPAFWDTHYSSALKNLFAGTMNFVTRQLGDKLGLKTTAFIYIIAQKK